ncbi:hypothetical protein SAMN05421786_107198 [Chryseobacterium ureilyticum]|uniref:Uncharacterized protein n=1 Tax=Chryseobacterium ureilyticum TaxID=373668 RepID=A0A1N7Q494_9FLAO|nr:hypothetical protein [Chryseobacterium ureilyticum]SIT17641.1 hypothetical protein SAMN05421786_107198 [Chryseobacterium ureilyticum]
MKKIIIRTASVALFAVSLQSCRTNEDYLSSGDEAYYSNKFQVFTQPNENGIINYPDGFAFLLKEYDKLYKTDFTGLKSLENEGNAKRNSISERHIDFDMRSQPIKFDDKVWVYFPVVENGKVVDIAIGVLQDEETYVQFGILNQKDEYNQLVLKEFREAYLRKSISVFSRGKEDPPPCGTSGNPCDTGEVIITSPRVPKLPNFDIGVYPGEGGGGGDGGGGCETFNNCGGPPRGGGGVPPKPKDPCEKTKNLINNSKTKPAIDALKAKSPLGGEDGYKIKADGTPSDMIPGGDHSVNFMDKTGYVGGYHNHTPTGIPMLSPPDIDQLLQFALAQGNYGNPKNAFIGMVAPNGMHYVITFNGNYNDALVTFSQQQLDEFVINFETRNYLYHSSSSAEGLEKLLFKTLKDMKIEGKVNLQRIETDGTISTITKNSDGTITATPC